LTFSSITLCIAGDFNTWHSLIYPDIVTILSQDFFKIEKFISKV